MSFRRADAERPGEHIAPNSQLSQMNQMASKPPAQRRTKRTKRIDHGQQPHFLSLLNQLLGTLTGLVGGLIP